MACLLKSIIKGLGLIQVCLIKKCYHLSVSRFISAWNWIINAFDWILLWSSWEKTQMTWASRTFPYILHFKQLVGVTDHRRHQNRNFRDKIGCTLCTTFFVLTHFLCFLWSIACPLHWIEIHWSASQRVLTVRVQWQLCFGFLADPGPLSPDPSLADKNKYFICYLSPCNGCC